MTRIVYYRLDEALFLALPMWQRSAVESWRRDGYEIASPAQVWSAEREAALTALGCTLVDLTSQHEIGWTLAPRNYDHGDTLEVRVEGDRRLVAVPLERLEAQCDRYASGCYGTGLEPEGGA